MSFVQVAAVVASAVIAVAFESVTGVGEGICSGRIRGDRGPGTGMQRAMRWSCKDGNSRHPCSTGSCGYR